MACMDSGVAGENVNKTAETILERIQKRQFKSLSSDVQRFLLPVSTLRQGGKENSVSQNSMRSLAKQYTPFLSQLLNACLNALASGPKVEPSVTDSKTVEQLNADALFESVTYGLEGLEKFRGYLKGRPYEIEIQRYNLIRRLSLWKRQHASLVQGWDLYGRLCKFFQQTGPSTLESSESFLLDENIHGLKKLVRQSVVTDDSIIPPLSPPSKSGDKDMDLVVLLTGVSLNIIVSTTECSLESDSQLYLKKIVQLPRQLEPWLSELGRDGESKNRDSIFRGLYKCALNYAAQAEASEKESMVELIRLTLSFCVTSTSAGKFVQVTRSLVDKSGQNANWDNVVFFSNVVNMAIHQLLEKTDDGYPFRRKHVLELVSMGARKFLQSDSQRGSQFLRDLLPSISQAVGTQSSAFASLYTAALDLQTLINITDQSKKLELSKQENGRIMKSVKKMEPAGLQAAICRTLSTASSALERLIEETKEMKGRKCSAVFQEGAESLDFFQKVAVNYADLVWAQYSVGHSKENSSVGIAGTDSRDVVEVNYRLVEVLKLTWPFVEVADTRDADCDCCESDSISWMTTSAISATMAAFRLCFSMGSQTENLEKLVLDIVESSFSKVDDVKWLMLSISNMGVTLFNLKLYDQAIEPLRLAYQMTSIKAFASILKGNQNRTTILERWRPVESNLVTQLCSRCFAFVDCLRRSGNVSQAVLEIENFLISWGWTAEVVKEDDGPKLLVQRWVKIKLSCNLNNRIDDFSGQLFALLKKADPNLSIGALGALLKEELIAYESAEPEHKVICMNAKAASLKIILSEVYNSESWPIERSQMLLESARLWRLLPGGNVTSSLEPVQNAVLLLENCLSQKANDKSVEDKWCTIEDCLSVSLCVRALCLREAEPESKEFLKDIEKAILIWENILGLENRREMNRLEKKQKLLRQIYSVSTSVSLLMAVADLLALEMRVSAQQRAHYLALSLASLSDNGHKDDLPFRLLADVRLSHILCPVQCSAPLALFGGYGGTVDIDSYLHQLQVFAHQYSPGSLLDAWLQLPKIPLPITLLPSQTIDSSEPHGMDAYNGVLEMLLSHSANSRRTVRVMVRQGAINSLLASNSLKFGRVNKALEFATESLRLRSAIFSHMFQDFKPPSTVGDQEGMNVGSKQFSSTGDGVKSTWPVFGVGQLDEVINDGGIPPTQWRVLGDYLESLHQMGYVCELTGLVEEAESHFTAGYRIAKAFELWHLQAAFASALGETYRKKHKWTSAAKQFHAAGGALQTLQEMHFPGNCQPCWVLSQAELDRRMGDLARRRTDGPVKKLEETCQPTVLFDCMPAVAGALEGTDTCGKKEEMNTASRKLHPPSREAVFEALTHYTAAESLVGRFFPQHTKLLHQRSRADEQRRETNVAGISLDSELCGGGEKMSGVGSREAESLEDGTQMLEVNRRSKRQTSAKTCAKKPSSSCISGDVHSQKAVKGSDAGKPQPRVLRKKSGARVKKEVEVIELSESEGDTDFKAESGRAHWREKCGVDNSVKETKKPSSKNVTTLSEKRGALQGISMQTTNAQRNSRTRLVKVNKKAIEDAENIEIGRNGVFSSEEYECFDHRSRRLCEMRRGQENLRMKTVNWRETLRSGPQTEVCTRRTNTTEGAPSIPRSSNSETNPEVQCNAECTATYVIDMELLKSKATDDLIVWLSRSETGDVGDKWSMSIWQFRAEKELGKVLVQQGKCHISLGHLKQADECFYLAANITRSSSASEGNTDAQNVETNNVYHPFEEASILLNRSRLFLRQHCQESYRKNGRSCYDMQSISKSDKIGDECKPLKWLYRAFKLCLHVSLLLKEVAILLAILCSYPVGNEWLQSFLPVDPEGFTSSGAFFHGVSIGVTSQEQHLSVVESKLRDLNEEGGKNVTPLSDNTVTKQCYESMLRYLRLSSFAAGHSNLQQYFTSHVSSKLPVGMALTCISAVDLNRAGLVPTTLLESDGQSRAFNSPWLLVSRVTNGKTPVVMLLPSFVDGSEEYDDSNDASSNTSTSRIVPNDKSGSSRCFVSSESDEESDARDGTSQSQAEKKNGGKNPVYVEDSSCKTDKLLSVFTNIMDESKDSTSSTVKVETKAEKSHWWEWRLNLDLRLQAFLRQMEDDWLGAWKCLLLPEPSDISIAVELRGVGESISSMMMEKVQMELGLDNSVKVKASPLVEEMVRLLVLGAGRLSEEQVKDGSHEVLKYTIGTIRRSQEGQKLPQNTGRKVVERKKAREWKLAQKQLVEDVTGAIIKVHNASSWKRQLWDAGGKEDVRENSTEGKQKDRKNLESFKNLHIAEIFEEHAAQHPIELVLDANLQALPWESLPSLRGERVYRMPNLASTLALLSHSQFSTATKYSLNKPFKLPIQVANTHSINRLDTSNCQRLYEQAGPPPQDLVPWQYIPPAVDPKNAFYLLNPSGDLVATEAAFKTWFETQQTWQGIVGQIPSADEYLTALQDHDLFVYCGHGSGAQFLPSKSIRKLHKCAASFLMGCSSGKLSNRGDYEPVGIPLAYFMAGCPVSVANLWDVTDGDIDRFSRAVLEEWLNYGSVQRQRNCTNEESMYHSSVLNDQSQSEDRRPRRVVEDNKDSRGSSKGKAVTKQQAVKGKQTEEGNGRGVKCTADVVDDVVRIGCMVDGSGKSVEALSPNACLSTALVKARDACRLKHLIGAAPVCYGVPTMLLKERGGS